MLLLIAHLLTKTRNWSSCRVRLFVVTSLENSEHENLKQVVRDMLENYRLLLNVHIEIIKITSEEIEPFSYNMDKEMKNEDMIIQQVALDRKFEDQKVQNLMKLNNYQRIDEGAASKNSRKGIIASTDPSSYPFEQQAITINRKILEYSEDSR